jgi:uncharacterized protein (TIGR00725 family)
MLDMTDAEERRKIVAVFGGNKVSEEVIALARWTGGEIADCGFIVLTGGRGSDPTKSVSKKVKDAAIDGARTRTHGRWIGVLNNTGGKPSVEFTNSSLIISPQMASQRNFLEANLCDASVVFEGGSGTLSEAVSMLCLGKPVLRVEAKSSGSRSLHQLFKTKELPAKEASELVNTARRKLSLDGGPMKDLIEQTVVSANLRSLPAHSGFVSTTSQEIHQAMQRWLESLRSLTNTGAFPELERYADVKRCYDGYLRNWET